MVKAYLHNTDELHLSSPQMSELMDDVLSLGLSFRFRAGGVSMSPFIHDGDVISIAPLAGRTPDVGEVVAFRRLDPQRTNSVRLVVHRVVKNTGKGCIILGDNQLPAQPDGPIANEHLLGTVSRVERRGKAVRLGLGPERYAIAILSRLGLLRPSVRFASILYRRFQQLLPLRLRSGKRV